MCHAIAAYANTSDSKRDNSTFLKVKGTLSPAFIACVLLLAIRAVKRRYQFMDDKSPSFKAAKYFSVTFRVGCQLAAA